MRITSTRDEALFADALAQPADKRGAFLDQACTDDPSLRARVAALLAAHESSDPLLDSPGDLLVHAVPQEKASDVIGRYKLLEKLGEGGCGAVWAAEQREPVKRRVALKIIKLGMDTRQVIARFEAERQALAMMDHPNIAKMLDAGATATGRPYFVMELVRGIPITAYCDENNLTTQQRLGLLIKVCHAIQHAHQKGIIHRDIKPSNVLVTLHDGEPVPKVIDFGIAKATQQDLTDKTIYTKFQQFIGTPAYMSPEQAEMSGLDIDTRSDIYSLGVLAYELVTGRTPFDSKALVKHGVDEIRRVIREIEPPRPSTRLQTLRDDERTETARRRSTEPRKLVASIRGDFDWIAMKCLEKDRTRRYETANGVATDLQRYLADEPVVARPPGTAYRVRKFVRRHRIGVSAAAMIIGVVVVGSIATTVLTLRTLRAERLQNELRVAAERAAENEALARRAAEEEQQRIAKIRWAREIALPEIHQFLKANDIASAFAVARVAEEFIPNDPGLTSLWPMLSATVSVETTPPGADVFIKPYNRPDAEWQHLGKSPLSDLRLARSFHRWRIEKQGFETVEKAAGWWWTMDTRRVACTLYEVGSTPPGMVRVHPRPNAPRWPLSDDFWIDKYEVTNREFKRFVDSGGYATEKFWKHAFVLDGETLTWPEAIAFFCDNTRQPGPAGWTNGTYPENEADHPVTGVSWFEAAAYAEFVGKRLPSISHWQHASTRIETEFIIPFSNFSARGPVPVGQLQGLSMSGAFDMAGNAKEWCWNETEDGRRFLLGGGWGEPEYMLSHHDSQSPFDRSPRHGFRCIKIDAGTRVPESVDAPVQVDIGRDFTTEQPASDEQFQVFKRIYAYDKSELDARMEGGAEENARWRRERVSFNTAYNGERMDALVFLPRLVRPPYQAIIYLPGAGAHWERSSQNLRDMAVVETLIETGRAVVHPIFAGTYERPLARAAVPGSVEQREWFVHVVQDVGRSIDYLETRPDIEAGKLAFVGYSWGATLGPIVSALENRIKVNVLFAGGLTPGRELPEADPFNFASRVTSPMLMINGRLDFISPLETSQMPFFNSFGTPAEHKRHLLFEGGHGLSLAQASTELREWFDRYLGPVN